MHAAIHGEIIVYQAERYPGAKHHDCIIHVGAARVRGTRENQDDDREDHPRHSYGGYRQPLPPRESAVRQCQTFSEEGEAYEPAHVKRPRPPFCSTYESADDWDDVRDIEAYDPKAENGRDGSGASECQEPKEERYEGREPGAVDWRLRVAIDTV